MATAPEITHDTGTDLIVLEAQRNAVALFTDGKQYDEFFERVRDSVSDFVPDVTTDRGRREIASVAFKVTKAKTTLDKAGFALTEEWRQKTNAVNAARKKMTTQLDELAAEVRRPLTEWEEKEAERDRRAEAELQRFRNAGFISESDTATDVDQRADALHGEQLDAELFQERLGIAADAKATAVETLRRGAARLRQEEADRAELDRLRRESAEREEAERIQREARDREDAERRQREEAERSRVEAEERRKAEIAAAEERARVEAQDRERQAAEERVAEERRGREAAERETDEVRRKEEERLAWDAKEKREREAREADERHRKVVLEEAAEDITDVFGRKSGEEPTPELLNLARAVANAIAAGTIRHVSVRF